MSIMSFNLTTIACQLLLASCIGNPFRSSKTSATAPAATAAAAPTITVTKTTSSSISNFFNSNIAKNILYVSVFILIFLFAAKIVFSIVKSRMHQFNETLKFNINKVKDEKSDIQNKALENLIDFLKQNKSSISNENKDKLHDLYKAIKDSTYLEKDTLDEFEKILKDMKIEV